MRNINCRSVRRIIEETDPDKFLSVAVRAHIASCVACETLSQERGKLQTIISRLGPVEAPDDFDFRLRARLAGEKRQAGPPYAMRNFSFSLRAAALATVLLLIGSAFVFVTFRTRPSVPAVVSGQQVAVSPGAAAPVSGNVSTDVKPVAAEVTQKNSTEVVRVSNRVDREPQKRRSVRNEALASRGNSQDGTLDLGSTRAPVLRPNDEATESYPTAAFPINASYQSLKVSVDDGRGASRTISLPTVSFGSQRALSQNASALIPSSRGVW
jgi:hypothetical protein